MVSYASNIYKDLIKGISQSLKSEGFSRKGQSFYTKHEENWGVINFQKSTSGNEKSVVFTVNLGIASGRLFRFSGKLIEDRPLIEDCHWRQRLGFLLPEKKDVWWTIVVTTLLDRLVKDMENLLCQYGIPEIEKNIRDETLRDLWLTGKSPGLTNFERLKNLSVLIKAIGPTDLLNSVLEELKHISEGQPFATTARYHIQRLNLWTDETTKSERG